MKTSIMFIANSWNTIPILFLDCGYRYHPAQPPMPPSDDGGPDDPGESAWVEINKVVCTGADDSGVEFNERAGEILGEMCFLAFPEVVKRCVMATHQESGDEDPSDG